VTLLGEPFKITATDHRYWDHPALAPRHRGQLQIGCSPGLSTLPSHAVQADSVANFSAHSALACDSGLKIVLSSRQQSHGIPLSSKAPEWKPGSGCLFATF
jgi:hypothetical protein